MRHELQGILAKQGYGVVGDHAAVKLCHYTKSDLKTGEAGGKACYKNSFYGIESHRCMQMTPVVDYCNFRCLYCWRSQDFDTTHARTWDDPEDIFAMSLDEQRRLLSGYKGRTGADVEKWIKANRPKHVAISLNGEPTVYPHLPEFIRICHDHGMTTFLVTNGSFPEMLQRLEREDALPTQLYLSVDAPNKEIFDRLCVPITGGAWERFEETVDLLSSLKTRVVARHTMVKGWNMGHYEEYARLDRRADADFVEVKGYSWVGYSRERMTEANIPSHGDIREQTLRIGQLLGYPMEAERPDARVALLVRPGAVRFLGPVEEDAVKTGPGEAFAAPLQDDDAFLPMAGAAGGCGSGGCGCGH